MKLIKNIALLAFASLAFLPHSAKAYSYSSGDMFLGFYSVNATKDYLLYIGNYSNYTQMNGATITLNTQAGITIGTAANVATDLSSCFNGNTGDWTTDSTVLWGAVGTINSKSAVMFVTDPSPNGTVTQFPALAVSDQTIASNDVVNMGTQFGNSPTLGVAGAASRKQNNGFAQSYYDSNPSGTVSPGASFDLYNPNINAPITQTSLNLYEMVATNASTYSGLNAPGTETLLGTFNLNTNGTITFQSVPEPSATAVMVLGAGLFLAFARLRAVKA